MPATKPPDTAGAWPKPAINVETLVLAGAVFLMLAVNGPFWRAALAGHPIGEPSTWLYAGAIFASFTAFYFAAAALVATRHTVKPLLMGLFMVSAAAAYYMDRYAVYFDRAMIRNVFATDYQEAKELLSGGLVLHLLAFGVVPSLLVWRVRLKRRSLGRGLLVRLGWIAAALVAAIASLLLVFADFASLMRNHKEVRHLLTPGNLVVASAANAWGHAKRPRQPRAPVGGDAKLGAAWSARTRPALFVLVVGETARARNFSLNGYARQTNPRLAQLDVINFPKARACGTSTEVSLPCMFSPFGRSHYDEEKILTHESVLHVLARAGFQVLWRDNQSGCKGVCEGLPSERPDKTAAGALCDHDQCLDEVLVQGMEGIARDKQGNLFVVMHQLGSHGPAYFKRYPAGFKRFAPACETEDLRHCTQAEIVNAYDNSLLYTDFVLGKIIDFLQKAQATHDTAMLYVSDHGESLGEGGLYLHGVPYSIAPDVQLDVPFVMWLSPAFRLNFGVSHDCMRKQAARPVSHDNLFHSLLGVLDVQTTAYEPALDLFAPCRGLARETHPDQQSTAGRIGQGDFRAVPLRDRPDDSQPQPAAKG
jgi:lipid A ethanolaminephosphotransferase